MIPIKEIPKCISVANRIISRTNAQNTWRYELGKPHVMLSVKRIQKIMYLCQLFDFAENPESNMVPEDFVAWPNGPVVLELYDYWMVSHEGYMNPYPNAKYQLSERETEIINIVVDNTIDISTEAIIDYTHTPFGPWEEAYKSSPSSYNIIAKDRIKQYICNEEAQRQLIDFIKTETAKYENLGFSKKLTSSQNKD